MRKQTCKYMPLLAAAALFLTACTGNSGNSAENTASEFLNAYLSTDFNKAATFCTEKLSGELKEAVKEVDQLDESIKKHILATTGKYKPQIEDTQKSKTGDTVIVNYSILEQVADSTAVSGSNLIKSSLYLIKDSTGQWKVAKLNK